MYSFAPLAPVTVDHTGFGIVFAFCVIALIICLMSEPETFFVWFFILCFPAGIAYGVSYHWTNQDVKYYPNVKVEAQLVGFETEGYREKSGKSMVDRHLTYVIYSVNGDQVLLNSTVGMTYPKVAILYKN